MRERDYSIFTPPPDPILKGAAAEVPNYNSATGRRLFHQSHLPLGPHAGKIMERVPAQWLLNFRIDWRARSPGLITKEERTKWWPVWVYTSKHEEEIAARAKREPPLTAHATDTVDFRVTLVGIEEAKRRVLPNVKCELCLDDEGAACFCDAGTRRQRNEARGRPCGLDRYLS